VIGLIAVIAIPKQEACQLLSYKLMFIPAADQGIFVPGKFSLGDKTLTVYN
jgi:hypothetical protein